MKFYRVLLASLVLFASFAAHAAIVTVTDGDVFDYDSANTYVFDLVLTAVDPIVSFGANLEPGEGFALEIAAPNAFDIRAVLNPFAPSLTYILAIEVPRLDSTSPFDPSLIPAGMSYAFSLSGDNFSGTQWLTIGLTDAGIAYLEANGGGLDLSPNPVPVPAAIWFMLSALGTLLGRLGWRRG